MARIPTLPLEPQRRNRAPSVSNTNGNFSLASTRPLQIGRPPSRPVTPSTTNAFAPSSPKAPAFASPKGPVRPQRSELRSRQTSDYSASERTSTSSRVAYDYNSRDRRDSSSTTRSDASTSQRFNNGTIFGNKPRLDLALTATDEGVTTSPVSSTTSPSLSTIMAAFKDAGARRRRMTDEADEDFERERRAEIERQKVTQERIRDRIPGRRATGKAKAGDIDAVLDEIKDDWEFVIDPDFNNVELALSLLDGPSSGKSLDSFTATKVMLSQALKGSVDKHYKAFADALPHHTGLLNHLGLVQTQAQETRISLQEAKEALGTRRADLVQLWSRGQILEEMMRLLDEIEHLKSIPDVLEALISEKRLIQASVLLVRSLKLINKPDMQEIGAVYDLRSYLTGQETALREILVDELHNHLYLKSFWCDMRWAAYIPNQTTLPKVAFEDEFAKLDQTGAARSVATPFPHNSQPTRLSRYLSNLGLRPNDPPYDLNELSFHSHGVGQDISMTSSVSIVPTSTGGVPTASSQFGQTTINPEADSFAYIEMLLESLAVLGKVGTALDTVIQRLPSEIYAVVEATVNEVEERAEQTKRSSLILSNGFRNKSEGGYIFTSNMSTVMDSTQLYLTPTGTTAVRVSTIRLAALESSTKRVDQEILKDLFWSMYSKLYAAIQGLRVVFEVSNRIGARRDFKDSSGAKPGTLFPIADVWALVQAEVRTLLYDYLTDEEQSSVTGRNPITSINEVLREGRFTRDKLKTIFRFSDSDIKASTKILRKHEDELMLSLRETMPGLVQSSSESAAHTALSTVVSDDHTLGTTLHHRLLIKPDPFHVSVLFQPTLAFLSQIADVLPQGMESVRSAAEVLDNFVLQVYLPQLEEKISWLFHHAVSSPDAFQPDILSTRFSPLPILKVTTQIMALINSLCAMLRTTPFHQENYSRLIIGVIIQFYQRCSDRFHDLVSGDQNGGSPSHVSLAAQWAQRPELSACLSELYTRTDPSVKQQLCRQEMHLEMGYLSHASVGKDDLTASIRSITALCSLHRSVAWFTQQLIGLKSSSESSLSPTSASRVDPNVFTPFTPSPFLPSLPVFSKEDDITLPLSREMGLRFGALLKTYTQLAEIILHTIRIEIRCRVMYYVDAAFRLGNFDLDREIGEPDPYIVGLNMELGKIDECVLSTLLKEEQDFVFCGLEHLVEHLLIAGARHIRMANKFGIEKLMRDILALQQGIRTIESGQQTAHFERARMYYSLFTIGPQGLLDSARANKVFSFDEYKVILDLQCGVDRGLGDAEVAKAADHNYGMYAIELHGLELESSVDTGP